MVVISGLSFVEYNFLAIVPTGFDTDDTDDAVMADATGSGKWLGTGSSGTDGAGGTGPVDNFGPTFSSYLDSSKLYCFRINRKQKKIKNVPINFKIKITKGYIQLTNNQLRNFAVLFTAENIFLTVKGGRQYVVNIPNELIFFRVRYNRHVLNVNILTSVLFSISHINRIPFKTTFEAINTKIGLSGYNFITSDPYYEISSDSSTNTTQSYIALKYGVHIFFVISILVQKIKTAGILLDELLFIKLYNLVYRSTTSDYGVFLNDINTGLGTILNSTSCEGSSPTNITLSESLSHSLSQWKQFLTNETSLVKIIIVKNAPNVLSSCELEADIFSVYKHFNQETVAERLQRCFTYRNSIASSSSSCEPIVHCETTEHHHHHGH